MNTARRNFSPKLKPLIKPARYKGAKGGRASGKSHFFAEILVLTMYHNPDFQAVGIREVQKSLKFSAKKLIEEKIEDLCLASYFVITQTEIRRRGGKGIIIFQGMQDHTADSIKSLEGFDLAWVEEAQNISKRSLELLTPTIRKEGSEIWFSWNPDAEDDPVDVFLRNDPEAIIVHINYIDNPHCSDLIKAEAEKHRVRDPDTFDHVWLGEYRTKSEEQVLHGKWRIAEFEVTADFGDPLFGLDFGFAQDPTAAVECYYHEETLYVRREAGRVGLELDDTASYLSNAMPKFIDYTSRADSARPESISYLKRHGLPKIQGVQKWSGSVQDGIGWLRSCKEIVIHADCKQVAYEAAHYKHKTDRRTGDILPDIIDADNHYIDAIRYAVAPLIKKNKFFVA
jgi:phage terminase large subunit